MDMLPPEKRNPGNRPNILFIITDQQQWKMMSCAGNAYLNTPAMDSLAENGVRFDRSYAANPICVPSRMSMVLGLMPSQMNMVSNASKYAFITDEMRRNSLGWLMQYAGYDVGYAGKVHLSIKNTPESLGFNNYLTWDDRDECAEVSAEFIKQERDKPFFLVTSLINPHDICYLNMREFPVSDRIRYFLGKNKTELEEVERALEQRERISDETFYSGVCPPLPENFEPIEDEPEAIERFLESTPAFESVKCCREKWGEKEWRLHRYVYARLTERVDGQVGRVLEALHESGQDENTVVVFVSDHGDNDASRRITQKSMPYDESIRVPFIISRKGMQRAGQVDHSLVSTGLDLIPTVCDYAGIDPPTTSRGKSARPQAEGLGGEGRDHVFVQTPISRTIVSSDWQYITFYSGKNQEQLFNLKEDPHAKRNLIKDPQYQEKAEALRQILIDEVEAIDDQVGRDMLERSEEWKGLPSNTPPGAEFDPAE